ncbi:acyl-CoA synthetase/AMP-acid ligase [Schinkia azotoformans MEV2011]|uniref:acetate--CoA ligase n=1 Tax=Schinkia azotoformans MEV2011 TaxID=1348973 RepID=A0A072NKA6_SCHAZ|nr:acetate--CoA ligase [Schinkia azotoformans]KEF37682.1 acyl-CoA synthetase/AMP-acid ligase [Schinkia azotoformans MEV2011]MEC1697934.1 acetate--CoA ligase [Schinkia azotoformans]MEC1725162.1 acetate--CoA ligase [Schinkia azotoformans]MEC1781287.1 acetate--CoA ligase [Schinkia azotoformans]MED4330623.1 acetate--CoA ligase [Schinkia azotoformans]
MDVSGILKVVSESKLVYPGEEKQAKTSIGSSKAFQELLQQSQEDPVSFWDSIAKDLVWYEPWKETMSGQLPDFRFFDGGISNPSINLLDRHVENGAGNRTALIWEGENGDTKFYTYNMLLAEVNRFANVLRSFGVKKGDCVAIFLPNLAEAFIAVLACFRIGAIYNTIFSGYSEKSLKDRLVSFEPKIIVTTDATTRRGNVIRLKEKVDAVVPDIPSIEAVIVVDRLGTEIDMQEGRDYWWDELTKKASIVCEPERLEANEYGIVFYTSGTTGKPKGVVHSGMAFVVQNYIYAKYHMDHHDDDVFWCTADIGWLTMHIWGITGALANGVTTIVYEGSIDHPTKDRFYQIIEKYRVNKLFTAPTALRMLKSLGEKVADQYDLSCLDVISLVGEPFDPETWQWTYKILGKKNICVNNTWGQTETAGCPIAGAAWLTPMKPGSAGMQFLGADVAVVDEAGNPVKPGTLGNLVIRKPFPMLCRTLWKEPERYYASYFSQVEGCYFASDLALIDEEGYVWVVGRSDDAFNVAGHRLSTMEIESAVMECEGVAEAAVIGIPDEIKGEIPLVFARLTDISLGTEELKEKINDRIIQQIGKIALPKTIVFTETLPKTVSGKIMRRLLKEIIVAGTVSGDITGLEDPATVAQIKNITASGTVAK